MIIPSIIEKFSFAAAAAVLFILQRVPVMILIAGLIDFAVGRAIPRRLAAAGC